MPYNLRAKKTREPDPDFVQEKPRARRQSATKEQAAKESAAKRPVARAPVAKEPVARAPIPKTPAKRAPVARKPIEKESTEPPNRVFNRRTSRRAVPLAESLRTDATSSIATTGDTALATARLETPTRADVASARRAIEPPGATHVPAKRPAPKEILRAPRSLKKPRIETFRFENVDEDPIIESLREMYRSCPGQVRAIDSELLDHIALEGLTGITFSRLCLVLDALIPALNSCKDDAAQDHIWSIVSRYSLRVPGARVQIFYLDPSLPDESSPHELHTQPAANGADADPAAAALTNGGPSSARPTKKSFYVDKSIRLPEQTLKWLDKVDWMLHPVQDGHVMGSCPRYKLRVNISDEVASLHQAHGPRHSLLAVHEKYHLKNVYLVADQELRRRAILPTTCDPNMDIKLREYACLELIGRTRNYGIVFPNDKTLGRYRILLSAKGLISQFQQTCNTFIIHHLRRFTQYSVGVTVAKAFKGGRGTGGQRQQTGPAAAADEVDGARAGQESETVPRTSASVSVRATCCHPGRLKSDRHMLRMVYDVIAASRGRSMCDIRRKLGIPKHHARNHLKNLANIELIGSHTRIVLDKKTRIYRARHRSSRKRLLSQAARYLKGVRSKWDSVDVRARDILGNRRSQFSQAEDSLLILCRISSLLLQPNLTKLSFVVPKQVIRDILHDDLYESHDKTSDSLLRRTKFLRKMSANHMLINELVAELRDDTDIVRLVGIKREHEELARSTERLVKLFKQVLRSVRAKLPHLLGLTSSSLLSSGGGGGAASGTIGSGALVASNARNPQLEFASLADLKRQFELIDCQAASATAAAAATQSGAQSSGRAYHQPASTLVQLAEPIPGDYRLEISKCSEMRTIMLLASCCVASSFNLDLRLKVPVRVVGLDQDSENFKEMFEHAKGSKETSRLIANLTTPNPTADSRRALFMLRNALKLETIDKCGKLADALVVQPCDIAFASLPPPPPPASPSQGQQGRDDDQNRDQTGTSAIAFDEASRLVRKFLDESRFIADFFSPHNKRPLEDEQQQQQRHPLNSGPNRKRRRVDIAAAAAPVATTLGPASDPQAVASTSAVNASAPPEDPKLATVLAMAEAVMSWVSVMPGIELGVLQRKLRARLGKRNNDHLSELLELMQGLELIACERTPSRPPGARHEPRLFGYEEICERDIELIVTYEPRENAYLRYCQLINLAGAPSSGAK